jgi:hypothetical protein
MEYLCFYYAETLSVSRKEMGTCSRDAGLTTQSRVLASIIFWPYASCFQRDAEGDVIFRVQQAWHHKAPTW